MLLHEFITGDRRGVRFPANRDQEMSALEENINALAERLEAVAARIEVAALHRSADDLRSISARLRSLSAEPAAGPTLADRRTDSDP
jgi:hypothetical protein